MIINRKKLIADTETIISDDAIHSALKDSVDKVWEEQQSADLPHSPQYLDIKRLIELTLELLEEENEVNLYNLRKINKDILWREINPIEYPEVLLNDLEKRVKDLAYTNIEDLNL